MMLPDKYHVPFVNYGSKSYRILSYNVELLQVICQSET